MQIRTFTASKLHQALSMVRMEFGPEAMILDRTKVRDNDGNPIWQVRAVRDMDNEDQRDGNNGSNGHNGSATLPQALDHRLTYSMQHLEQLVSSLGRTQSDSLRQSLADDEERRAFDVLLGSGVMPTCAHDLAPAMARDGDASAACLSWGKRLQPRAQRETVLITGPAGGGKTTMIANLAAHFHLQGIRVALVSTDTERMAGVEGLAAYASVLGIPLHAMRRIEDAPDILQKTESARLLLIDSEGWSQASRKSLRRQQPLWQALAPNRRMLLLPANLDEADGMATLDAAGALQATDLVPGKLDETSATGKVVNWAVRSRLPLSYCSFGPAVPDQMGWLSPRTLATLLQRNQSREKT